MKYGMIGKWRVVAVACILSLMMPSVVLAEKTGADEPDVVDTQIVLQEDPENPENPGNPENPDDPVTPEDPYVVIVTEGVLSCTYNGETVANTALALLAAEESYTVVQPGTADSVVYVFDENGTGTKQSGKTVLEVSFGEEKAAYYVINGALSTSSKARKIILDGYVYQVEADGKAAVYIKDASKTGTYPLVIDNVCYKIAYKTGKVGAKYTGICDGKYYKTGILGKAKKAYYLLLDGYVYKVAKTGKAAKDTLKKSGKHQRLIGKICYTINNKTAKAAKFTGMYNKKCYKKGKLTTGWQTIGKKKYYCKKGVPVKGKKKIKKKWYFFNNKGVLATKDTTVKKVTYYIDDNGYLEAYKGGSDYYRPAGTKLSKTEADDYVTLRRARAVVKKVTTKKMTKAEKLKACFDFVKKYKESRPRTPHYTGQDWPIIYANDMFVGGSGNCFSFAAAFAYMAKAIGYEKVYACSSGGHGWAEIDGLVYDPEWSIHYHKYSYYGITYSTKTDVNYRSGISAGKSWMHVKVGLL